MKIKKDMKDPGQIIINKVLDVTHIKMELNMRVCGMKINLMVKDNFHIQTEQFMKEVIKMELNMDLELYNIRVM